MTAEIAILNKTAVALAADSAVTISAGQKEEKIWDSGDKLFELSHEEPIGIMVYNGMSFMEMPLPTLIKQFRDDCDSFNTIEAAAAQFLEYLNEKGLRSSQTILKDAAEIILTPILFNLKNKHTTEFVDILIEKQPSDKTVEEISNELLTEMIERRARLLRQYEDATFIRRKTIRENKPARLAIESCIERYFSEFSEDNKENIRELGRLILRKNYFSSSSTGIVVAGFGKGEIFPTLIEYEIEGIVYGGLKYRQVGVYDIDREKLKAIVLPFAQKEMVDRFLYGLDDDIQSDVRKYCKESISEISDKIIEAVEFENDGQKKSFTQEARKAESVFLRNLDKRAFQDIRTQSRIEIEDMVEFMPKPELARMAEALVELTSIKRRVSRGLETVGGPIDVAVISKTEGFVWVKRKHYFSADLNPRYFQRVKHSMLQVQENNDESTGEQQTSA